MANAERDANRVTTMLGVDSIDGVTPRNLEVDNSTGRLLVDATGGSGGGSVQYESGTATVATPIGTLPVFDDGGVITAVSDTNPLPVLASVDTTGLATDSNQTNGSQKTQIVDAGGEAVTVTGGKLDVNASVDTTGLATSAKQDTGNVSLSSIDGKITAVNTGAVVISSSALPSGAATAALQTQPGVDIGDVTINNASGGSAVNIQDGGNSITVDGSVTAVGGKTNNNAAPTTDNVGVLPALVNASSPSFTEGNQTLLSINTTGNLRATINQLAGNAVATGNGASSTGVLRVAQVDNGTGTIATVGAVTAITNALPAGTNAIGKLSANSGVDIGDVDVTSIPGIVGTVADDATTPGAPVMIGGSAKETDGTDPGSVSAEDDVARLITDRNRILLVNTTPPRNWSISADYASAQTNTSVKATPGSGLKLYITDISISNGATAGNITLLNGSGGTVLYEIYPAINGGAVDNRRSPIVLSADTALCITSTTVTTHSLNISGYIAP